jgi:hypothetical protein
MEQVSASYEHPVLRKFEEKLKGYTRKAVCGRQYVCTEKLQTWLRSLVPGTRYTQTERLLYAVYPRIKSTEVRFLPIHPDALLSVNDCGLVVFSILLNLRSGHFIDKFIRHGNGIKDKSLPMRLPTLEFEFKGMRLPEAEKLALAFREAQRPFCAAKLDLNIGWDYDEDRIIPICRKDSLNEKGATAHVSQIVVQEDFVGETLRGVLKTSGFEDTDDNLGYVSYP